MLTEYIERAMSKAKYKKLADGTYCGTIRPCPGAIAFGKTLRECKRDEFIRKLRKLGFSGPEPGSKHAHLRYG